MNLSTIIDRMQEVVAALAKCDPEKARYFDENFLSATKSLIPCKMLVGDRSARKKMAPQTVCNEEKSLITRYQPGEAYAAVQNPDLGNLLEVRTPALKNEAICSLNFNLGAHAEYAVNAATVDAVARPADIFVLAKTGLLLEDEIKTLEVALPRFRALNPAGELPLIYLHVAEEVSPAEAEAQYQANMDVLSQISGGVTKSFLCSSLDDDDVHYTAYREFWSELASVKRELYLEPLCDSFMDEVSSARDSLRLRVQNLSEEYQELARIDEQTYDKLLAALHSMNDATYLHTLSAEWQKIVRAKTLQIDLAFKGEVDDGDGELTIYDVGEELADAPTDADPAHWDGYRISKTIEVNEAYAGIIKSVDADLEAQFTGLRHKGIDQINDVLAPAGIVLPKALQFEIMNYIFQVQMRPLRPENLTSTADRCTRYVFLPSIGASIAISVATGVATLIVALKAGGEAAAAGAPLGPPGILIAGVLGAGTALIVAHLSIKSQDIKAYRTEFKSKMNLLLSILNTKARHACTDLGTLYGESLIRDLKAIRQRVIDIVNSYQKMSPEDMAALLEQMQAAIKTLDSLLDNEDDSVRE